MNMKYIITENRLDDFMMSYLDTLLESKHVSYLDSFIVISDKVFADEEEWKDIMEFDKTDGRLWLSEKFVRNFDDLFGRGRDESIRIITKWFENKFNVESDYQET
jgi:hypothetical protein